MPIVMVHIDCGAARVERYTPPGGAVEGYFRPGILPDGDEACRSFLSR